MYPLFQHLGNEPLLVIVLKIFDKGFDNLSGNAFTKSIGMSGGTLKFSLVYVFLPQHQKVCTTGICWYGVWGWRILHGRAGRICTIAARCLFNELTVVSGGTSRLKSIFLTVLPLIFFTVLYHYLGLALKSSLTLLR